MEAAAIALHINPGDPIFIGDLFGFIIALPVSLFLAFWMSAVKSRAAVVFGAFIGALLGALIILSWAGTLIFDTSQVPGANGGSVFFGSVLFCSIMGVAGGFVADLLIARKRERDYRRQISQE